MPVVGGSIPPPSVVAMSSPGEIEVIMWAASTAVIICLLGIVVYFLRGIHDQFIEMSKVVVDIRVDSAANGQRLDDHINNESAHCRYPQCRDK